MRKFFLLHLCFLLVLASNAFSQVAISASVRGSYDDNVFLESGIENPNLEMLLEVANEMGDQDAIDQLSGDFADGLEDEDFIYNIGLDASGGFDNIFGNALNGGWNAGVGFLIFTDFTDNNRLTVDSGLQFSLADTILPEPFFANVSSNISSQTVDAAVASNSAARATQIWTSNFRTGIQNYKIGKRTNIGAGYDFTYSNFLGEFLLQSDNDNGLEQNGTDFFTHRLFFDLDNQLTKSYNTGFSLRVESSDFTNIESNDFETDVDSNDLDRFAYEASWVNTYVVSEKLSFSGSVGVNITSLKSDPIPTTVFVLDENGEQVEESFVRDRTQSGLIFEAGMSYNIEPGSSFSLRAVQNRVPDIDGDLLTTRNFGANFTKALGDRFSSNLSANFISFSGNENLSNSLDRVEASARLSYAITQDTTISLGYFFSDQDSDDTDLETDLLFQTADFTSNRFFIEISSGLLGTRS